MRTLESKSEQNTAPDISGGKTQLYDSSNTELPAAVTVLEEKDMVL